jgi:hypothetical protein
VGFLAAVVGSRNAQLWLRLDYFVYRRERWHAEIAVPEELPADVEHLGKSRGWRPLRER